MPRRSTPSVVRTFEEARSAYVAEDVIALDLETGGFSPFRDPIHVITLYGPVSNTIAVLHYPRGCPVPQNVLDWISNFPELVTHNGTMFDLLFLAQAGMEWDKPRLYDTMIGELSLKIADRRDVRVNLQDTLKRRLGREIDKTVDHAGWGLDILSPSHMEYVTGDIAHLIDLKEKQLAEAEAESTGNAKRCIEFENKLAKAVIRMELNGLPVDLHGLEEFFSSRHERHEEVCAFLREKLGPEVNVASHIQLKKAIEERFHYTMPDTKADRLLELVRSPGPLADVCQALLDWRAYQQRANMFGPEWRKNYVINHNGVWKVHGKFWSIGTNTGRFSSSEPNLQQIPRNMRGVFGGYDHLAVAKVDYKSIEVRIAAAVSNDQEMLRVINSGEDIHTTVASTLFRKPPDQISSEERRIAKGGSFTFLFGGGADTLYANAKAHGSDLTLEEAQEATAAFFDRFHGIKRARQLAEQTAQRYRQKTLIFPTGLRRQLFGPELKSTTLLNNYIQGIAAAGIKKSLMLTEERGLSRYVAAVVHDETVTVAPIREIEAVREGIEDCMIEGMQWALEGAGPVSIGVESTWGRTWSGLFENERIRESGVA